jgi:hypothetical protein
VCWGYRGALESTLGVVEGHPGDPSEHDGERNALVCRSHADPTADLVADLIADLVADLIADLVADPIADLITDLVADAYADTISGSRFPTGCTRMGIQGTHRYPQGTGGVLRCAVGVLEGYSREYSRGYRGVLNGGTLGYTVE